jgi:uncharacterized protein YjbI with pentapeptide repeats
MKIQKDSFPFTKVLCVCEALCGSDRKRVVCPEEKRMSGPKFCGGALPIDVLRFIFRFLSCKEIATLDNAMTNRNDREVFLLALGGTESQLRFSSNKEKFESEVRWCLSRGVVLTDLWIRHDSSSYFSRLILRNPQRVQKVSVVDLPQIDSQLTSAISQCSNLTDLELVRCDLSDSDLNICLSHLTKVRVLGIHYSSRLTSSFVQSIRHCPKLERLDLSYLPCVSDDELRDLLQVELINLNLNKIRLSHVSITDRSMTLIAQANSTGRVRIHFLWLPRVTWDGKLSYLRQMYLPQLYSDNEEQQVSGIRGFLHEMIFASHFIPIEPFVSMGFFSRVAEITSSVDASQSFITLLLSMFKRLIFLGHTSGLVEIGLLDLMLNLVPTVTEKSNCSYFNNQWLDCFLEISQISIHRQLLISKGILPKLKTFPLVRKIEFSGRPHIL